MSLIKFNNSYERMPDAKLLDIASYIQSQMTGNANFPTPDPTLAEVQTKINVFSDGVTAAKTGDRMKIAAKNQAKEELVDTLHLLAAYVAYTAKGSVAVAQTSGIPMAKTPSPRPPLTQPENLKVQNTDQTGEIEVSVNKVPGAVSYMHQYSTDAELKEESWQSMTCTQSKCTITGLAPGTLYYFRVVAIGRKDQVKVGYVASRVAA